MLSNLIIYALSFVGIWVGSGLAIKSVERLSKNLKLSSFAVSFLVLGFFTSVSEFSVGINAVLENDPEIYVGNLIGASIVIFMMILPLLAITSNKIKINKEFSGFNLLMSLIVIATPVILSIDGKIDRFDSLISLVLFGFLVVCIQAKKGLFERVKNITQLTTVRTGRELLKIIIGLGIVFVASGFVVDQTLYFSQLLQVSPFLISLLLIAVGTNVPELSFVVRSMFMRSNQVAFGDYVGSASFNTFLLGFLTLWYGKPVYLTNSYLISLSFLIVGLLAFYYFARTKNDISRLEGFILLMLYLLFVFIEIIIHKPY